MSEDNATPETEAEAEDQREKRSVKWIDEKLKERIVELDEVIAATAVKLERLRSRREELDNLLTLRP